MKLLTMTKGGMLLSAIALATNSQAADLGNLGDTSVSLKGYLKMDAIMSDYDSGSLGAGNLGRDFYVPSLTPVGGSSSSSVVDLHARQSRFGLETRTDLDGNQLVTYIEMDFLATTEGNERITNSYAPRMRHAYLQYNNWLFGQTWTTFQDVNSLPETLDFIGNTDATIFARQTQIRYTNGNFQFALENPETTVTPYGGGSQIVTDDNSLPDLVARYNFKSGDLSLSVSALARQLQYDDGESIDDKTSSFGLSLSGVYKIGKDDLKFMVNAGSGMGRYIGLNIANGAVINANDELEAIDSTGYYLSYRHYWDDQWRSTLSYSAIDIDNDTSLTGTAVSKSSSSVRANLLYSPNSRLTLGGEVAWAEREIETGDSGEMKRLQFSAKLTF